MNEMTSTRFAGYDALACAIVERAAYDYYEAQALIDTINDRYIKIPKHWSRQEWLDYVVSEQKAVIEDIESFFNDPWFETIMPSLDGKKALEGLKETYKREMFEVLKNEYDQKDYMRGLRFMRKFMTSSSDEDEPGLA